MEITSAKFLKGIVGPDAALDNSFPQVALVGRSNVGKSSIINILANQRNLARTSNQPGRTREINLYLINGSNYLLDLPGYGYAAASKGTRLELEKVINGYLFESLYRQKKVAVVIDAKVGVTKLDLAMIGLLEKHQKEIIVVANKIDKLKSSEFHKKMAEIKKLIGEHPLIQFSAEKRIGRKELLKEIF